MPLRMTLGELQHQCARKYADRPMLTMSQTGVTLSYAEFDHLTNQLAHGINEKISARLDYVAILAENSVEYLAASYALKKINAVEVSINCAMKAASLARMIDQTEAQVLITSSAYLDGLDYIREDITHLRTLIMIDDVKRASELFPELEIFKFSDVLTNQSEHIVSPAKDTDLATILFTSGTTGVSKGCMLSHRYAVRTAENMIQPFRLTENDCVYSPYPLSHIGAAYYDILPTMMTGGRIVLRERFSVSNFWPEVKRYGVTWFMMLGSVQQLLWTHPPCPEETSHKVTRCWGTPAPVPKADFDARFKLNLIPGGGYGSTDAGWVVIPQWDHPGGITLPHFEIAIVDDNDDPLPPDTPGELVIRPLEPSVMSDGYFKMPQRTVESWRNLWFHTGDIARIDKDGYFYFICRKNERIRVKGEMVSGYEVEEGVLKHTAVEDCAVIGVPDETGEESIKLFVVLKPGMSLSGEDLRAHCAENMAKFMIPKFIVFLDHMPRTSTGKPEKGKLTACTAHN